jgi:hypothetical protein
MQGNAPNSFTNNQQMLTISQNIPVQRSDRINKCIIILDTITRILTIVSLDFKKNLKDLFVSNLIKFLDALNRSFSF